MLGFPLGILSAAGAGGVVAGDFELISTTTLGTATPSVTFSNLGDYSSTYKHLQIRMVAQNNAGATGFVDDGIRFNGDTGSNYNSHVLFGNGSSVASFDMNSAYGATAIWGTNSTRDGTTSAYAPNIIDILDAYSTTKNKTIRRLTGTTGGSALIILGSGLWRSTSSTTSLTLFGRVGDSYTIGSRFSLYGIKG
jgi:hypothetical protein